MATLELAACLPVLVLVLGVALSSVSAVGARVRLHDAAREAARAAAKGDPDAARHLAGRLAPGARLQLHTESGQVVATVQSQVRVIGGLLPDLSIRERAVAAVEPRGASP